MDKRLEEATAPEVKEPYERCTSNALRRECYRRKLRIIKSGPYVNATKQGYIQLLRASDSSNAVPRWERLHARLETVDQRLEALYASLQAPAMTASDERRALLLSDVAFYDRLKHALKNSLLSAVHEV